jgi:O-antigen chain-terminating methyltransferase
MSDGFYRAFEERYRGSRQLIKGRLRAYLPFVEPLLTVYPAAAAIDLGCGRGEWLELLMGSGFNPMGVDLDAGMLEACLELGLLVEQGDALAYLSTLSNDSQAVVSAFHVVEHITFDQLGTLVAEALRVLKPGGLLIMETPNPENIVVATRDFYLDPTHQRPIPSMLLAFVAEYAGFARVKTLRLQESKELVNKGEVSLQDVFSGASPDYAVVAQKHAPEDVLEITSAPFSVDYGLSLENLLSRWDGRLDGRFDRLETKTQQAEAAASYWQTQANEWHERLLATHASSSWRITRPLRAIKRLLAGAFAAFGGLAAAVKLKVKKTFRPVVSSGISYVLERPALRKTISPCLKRFPGLRQRMLRVTVHTGAFPDSTGLDRPIAEQGHRTPGAAPDIDAILERIKVALEKGPGK